MVSPHPAFYLDTIISLPQQLKAPAANATETRPAYPGSDSQMMPCSLQPNLKSIKAYKSTEIKEKPSLKHLHQENLHSWTINAFV